MGKNLTRRTFLKVAGVGASLATVCGGLSACNSSSTAAKAKGTTKIVPTYCGMCFWKCGMLAHVEEGRITKLVGNPADPLCEGRLCPRGTGGLGAIYDPDRLKQPLLRVKNRGEEVWESVTWEKALSVVAEKMEAIKAKYGPESMALFSHGPGGGFFAHLINAFGSPNSAQPSFAQCRGPRDVGFELTFGEGIGSPERYDLRNAKMVVLIGSHLGENMHNTQVQEFADAIDNGINIVCVDPRFSVAASKANRWLPIKPGTDLALLLAWIHVILEEGLWDKEYVAQYAVGIEELRREVAGYTPEWAYPQTGIDPDTIRAVARDMGVHKPGVLVYPGRHATWYGDDTQRSRAIAILGALLGSWGRPGGFYLPGKAGVKKYPTPPYPRPARQAADGSGTRFPFASEAVVNGLRDATISEQPYPIKGWIVYGTNLIQAVPNPKETIEAIQKLDLLVAIDTMPAEICGWADVILPECTYLERYDELWAPAFRDPFVSLRQPVVAPMYQTKPAWWIARELGIKLGLEKYFPWKDIEEYLETRLQTIGSSLAELKEEGTITRPAPAIYLQPGQAAEFGTECGKIELYSAKLESAGFDPVPQYTPPDPGPPGYLRLIYGRSPIHTFGQTTNNRQFSQLQAENEAWINPNVAQELGIENGEYVKLINQDGATTTPIKAKVTERIRPECLYMVHGFGHTSRQMRQSFGKGADDTALVTRYKVDPLMGGTAMRGNFVRVEKVNS